MPLNLGPGHAAALDALQPSPYWGSERIWDTRVNNHNSMFGRDGRVWLAASVRGAENPAFCKAGVGSSVGQGVSRWSARSGTSRVFDVKTKKYTFVDTCFSTHHLQFGYDTNETTLDERRRPGRRLAEHEDVRPDGRRREVTGLDRTRARHQRQRQAGRVRRARPAAGSDEGHADQLRFLRGDAESGGRFDLGRHARRPRCGRQACRRARIHRRRRWPRSTACRCQASAHAARTSTARASCGFRSAAVTWAASIAASARRR